METYPLGSGDDNKDLADGHLKQQSRLSSWEVKTILET